MRDIDTVVDSHLHFDHCGNNHRFAHSTMLVHQAELAAAQSPRYTIDDWVNFPGANSTAIHRAQALTANVRVLPTPGHTPGHLSIEIDCGDSAVDLIVAQAAYSRHEFVAFTTSQRVTQPGMWDLAIAKASLQLLTRKPVRNA